MAPGPGGAPVTAACALMASPPPPAPGPSGIKQCYRTVKAPRRQPALAGEPPRRDRSKRHACPSCDKRFSSPGKLTQHRLSHTGELPFSCERCDKRFNSKFKLARHALVHSEARAFVCGTCGRSFNRKDHLANHARVHDPAKKVFACERPGCRKAYTSPLSARKHAALHAAEDGELRCQICERSFASRAEILHHLKVHAGSRTVKDDADKKFTCEHCDRRFFTAKDVRRHLVVHTGTRDFPCPHCPQKFGRKDHLVRHVKNAHPSAAVVTRVPSCDVVEEAPCELPIVKLEPETELTELTEPDVSDVPDYLYAAPYPYLMDPGEGPSGVVYEPPAPPPVSLPAATPRVSLPAFKQVFHTAQSPKPPPPPPQ